MTEQRLPPVLKHYPVVEVRDDLLGGSPVVIETRVPVRRIWAWHRRGVSVETLVKRYPTLGWEKVCGAIAFSYANEALMEADIARERALLDEEPSRIPGQMPKVTP